MHLMSTLALLTLLDFMVVSSGDLQQQYVGCFRDNGSNRVMGNQYTEGQMNVDVCWQRCKKSSYAFFGVEWYSECYCADKFDTLGTADNCNTRCGGNQAQMCGGDAALSVYSVCPGGRWHMECNATCNCRNHTTYGERCWRNGTCPGGCKSGWTGTGCGTDIDECDTNNGGCQHRCNNTPGSYNCSCDPGYTLNSNERTCDDIDECSVSNNNGNCSQGCSNTPGSYSCYCRPGYKNTDRYNRMCIDIDECATQNGRCDHYCHNTNGSYHCSCKSGFTLNNNNNRTCDDIDECAIDTDGCEHLCHNTNGSFYCSCWSGYTMNSDNKTCTDINECAEDKGGCQKVCSNTPGSFTCECPGVNWKNEPAYRLGDDQKTCENINECGTTNGGCEHYCHDKDGDFGCSCRLGYQKNVQDELGCIATKTLIIAALVGSIVFLIVIGSVIAIVCITVRKRRAAKEKLYLSVYGDDTSSVGSIDTINFEPAHHKGNAKNGRKSHQDTSLNEFVDTSPIYANFDKDKEESGGSTAITRVGVNNLPELVKRINKMPDLLQAEFKRLPLASEATFDFAQKVELKPKNRFKNILPYDKNRVKLSKLNNDPLTTYINASFIKGYTEDEKLIASHGPTMNTLNDFWRMIWEYNVGVIVMVTKCREELKTKCEQYWPETCEMEFGNIKTSPHKVEERPDRIVRTLQISKAGEPHRLVTQVQFTDWPDHGVPEHAVSLLAIRHAVKRLVAHDQYIVIHCSAGVGRTGTYLAIDYLLCQAENENFFDVCSYVRDLRDQRMHSVQTLDQYSFIFKALLEGLTLGETTLSLTDFKSNVPQMGSINPMTDRSFMATEFQMLQEMQPIPPESECADALSDDNKNKNRNRHIVPLDNRRVFVQFRIKGRTDYINAVYVSSFMTKNAYISTQLPLEETLGDFWNMCIDYKCKIIVFLSAAEYSEDVFSFLPASGDVLRLGKTSVGALNQAAAKENESIELLSVVTTRGDMPPSDGGDENVYANTQSDTGRSDDGFRVTIIQVILPDTSIEVRDALIQTHSMVQNFSRQTSSAEPPPIIVMSRDGVQHCGQFIAVSNLCDMIYTKNEVDVFQTVYNVKRAQPHFFTNMAEYEDLYRMTEAIIEKKFVYCNR